MSIDLTCPTCLGHCCPYCGSEYDYHTSCTPCPDCDAQGRRLPELAEWDAQIEVERTLRIDLARAEAERDRLRERVRQLDRVDRAWKRLDRAIEPERECICSDGSDVVPPDRVPVCAYHGGQTWWIVAEARAARAALDSDPDLAERTRRIRADE